MVTTPLNLGRVAGRMHGSEVWVLYVTSSGLLELHV